MDLLLPGQPERLERWVDRPCSPPLGRGPDDRDLHLLFEAEVGRESLGSPETDGPFRRVARAILAYRVFPASLVRGVLRRAPLEVGDTVGISYQVLGGIRLFFAARVIACFDGPDDATWRAGFTYRTLRGHPERGAETFAVEKSLATGVVTASLRSWSRPGLLVTRLGAPVSRWAQRHANRAALANLVRVAAGAASPVVADR
jgi:uncharacterized protein (UPF0548 family)